MDDDDEGVKVQEFKPSANFGFRMSKAQIFKMKQIFDAYDDDYDGLINMEFLGNAMRASGLLISNQEIQETKKALSDIGVVDQIEMSRFFILMATKFRDAQDMDKVATTAFKSIYTDPEDALTKSIPIKILRMKLAASGGEQLDDDESETFIRDIPQDFLDPTASKADFDSLIHWVLADLPDLLDDDGEAAMEEREEQGAGLETAEEGEGEGEEGEGEEGEGEEEEEG